MLLLGPRCGGPAVRFLAALPALLVADEAKAGDCEQELDVCFDYCDGKYGPDPQNGIIGDPDELRRCEDDCLDGYDRCLDRRERLAECGQASGEVVVACAEDDEAACDGGDDYDDYDDGDGGDDSMSCDSGDEGDDDVSCESDPDDDAASCENDDDDDWDGGDDGWGGDGEDGWANEGYGAGDSDQGLEQDDDWGERRWVDAGDGTAE